ncbi:TonB-dependent receptor [Novosphingobium sp. KCTC 2891]|uniref:TonB-dependent receptor family protein n=1 Tax=Novosphingobium sp. KCTC 2891 TaxID=2989730 RepID=UPI002221CACE|nr:TonB-dependent receptor [Novosphingobium sp. KCTC 2891]MCW1384077.1 TonB-dependent receptor [Novosphingobium sp. KCTC 2891]
MSSSSHAGRRGRIAQHTRLYTSALALLLPAFAAPAHAALADAAEEPAPAAEADDDAGRTGSTITVTGKRESEVATARARVDRIPGGASIIDSEDVERGKVATVSDLLAYQPGVIVQSVGGNDGIKVTVRGSGIVNGLGNMTEGIKYLLDGVGLTGPGGTSYELFEPLGLRYTEVLRGSNAFDYGAVTLGGAVNFVSRTGLTDPGVRLGIQGGSYEYLKAQGSVGGQTGNVDYYINGVYSRRTGFQEQTRKRRIFVSGNLGIRLSDAVQTRFYARYANEQHLQSAPLTLAQLKDNPRQTSAAFRISQADVDKYGSYSFANTTDWAIDANNSLHFGINYSSTPQHINTKIPFPSDSRYDDLNVSLRYTNTSDLFGLPSETNLGWFNARHVKGSTTAFSAALNHAVVKDNNFSGSYDNVISLGNSTELAPGLRLLLGVSAIEIRRKVSIDYTAAPINAGQTDKVNYHDWTVAPRIGVSVKPLSQLELFASYSKSVNPIATWGYSPSTYSTIVNYVKPLVDQKGETAEVGFKVKSDTVDASLSLYRSWIRNEFLLVQVAPATATSAALVTGFNASPTIHQGIEAGLTFNLWRGGDGSALRLRNAYTYNGFHFRNDPAFGDNQLPSIPRHFYQGELVFEHASGFYVGASVQSASSYFADYANTIEAPAYTILGAKAGYRSPDERWSVFVDGSNLTDRKYVAAVSTVFNAKGADTAAFHPGDGAAVVVGATVNF